MIEKQKRSNFTDNTVRINPENPSSDRIIQAAQIIKQGGIIAFPTRCLYGIGADAFNADAIDRVFRIKKRPVSKPIPVLVSGQDSIDELVRRVPPAALRIIESFWPGKITIVFEAKDSVPCSLTAKTGKIGIRVPEHKAALALVKAVNRPISATSANLSGQAGCSCVRHMDPSIANRLDLILDAGVLKGTLGSTVIDVTLDPPRILREGEVPAEDIFEILSIFG